MHIWQLQEAKAKLTQFVNEAKNSPQIISRRGEPEIVAMSIEKYNELTGSKNSFVAFLKCSPLHGLDLKIVRDKSPSREVDL